MIKKNNILAILFFASLWGAVEASLGGFLYAFKVPLSSVSLAVAGFVILTIARAYLPFKGSSTLIASLAMLYKFLNAPFFGCHLLGIFLLGFSYDLLFDYFKQKSKALFGLCATYLGYLLFGLTITYVFRYQPWVDQGLPKLAGYIFISGTLASCLNFFALPLAFTAGKRLAGTFKDPFELRPCFASLGTAFITFLLWSLILVS